MVGCKDYPAFSTPWVHSGGMEVYTERMVRSLAGRAEFTLYTAAGASDAAARVVPLGAARGVRTQPLSLVLRSWRKCARGGGGFQLLNPQTPLAGLVARMAKRRFGIPYVVTVHVFGTDRAHAGGRLAAAAYGRVQEVVFSEAAAIIPTGRRLADDLSRLHPEIRSRVRAVTAAGSGVSAAAERDVTRAHLGIGPTVPCLLFLGRIVRENGLLDLLGAMAQLKKGFPDVKLLIAGGGDGEADVERCIRFLQLESAVTRLGPVRGQEKVDLLAAADLLVRTSRHEVFPEAYLEALSVGTPVAATPAGDTEHLAHESGAVALLPFGDPPGQARVIDGLLRAPETLARMRAGALDYCARERWEGRKEAYWDCLAQAAGAAAV